MGLNRNQDIIDRMLGIVPRLIESRETDRATYAHVVTEDHSHIWRARLKYPYAESADGLIQPMSVDRQIFEFADLQAFIDHLGFEPK